MQEKRLPEFIIIGAVKAATTWTSTNLARNPRLFVPGPEPHFFSSEYHRGSDWYSEFFEEAEEGAVIGEKSADYLAHAEAARRISAMLPDVRLVAQLRNPIDRAYSDYCMLYRRGTVTDSPEAYFSATSDIGRRFLEGGLYATHLSRFFDRFPRENIMIFPFEDVSARPRDVLVNVSEFIGVEPYVEDQMLQSSENDSATPILPLPMRKALKPFKAAVAGLRGKAWFETARGVFARPVRYPALSAEAHQRLVAFYEDDIQKLGGLTGRDFSKWLESGHSADASPPPAVAFAGSRA